MTGPRLTVEQPGRRLSRRRKRIRWMLLRQSWIEQRKRLGEKKP